METNRISVQSVRDTDCTCRTSQLGIVIGVMAAFCIALIWQTSTFMGLTADSRPVSGRPASLLAFAAVPADVLALAWSSAEAVQVSTDRNRTSSIVTLLNRMPGGPPLRLKDEDKPLFRFVTELAARSGGAWDPTDLPLRELWKDFAMSGMAPTEEEIEKARSLVDWKQFRLMGDAFGIGLNGKDMAVQLDEISGAFALDQVMETIRNFGVSRAEIGWGERHILHGSAPDGRPWPILLRIPDASAHPFATIFVQDRAVAVAGLMEGGYPAMDPRNGRQVKSGLQAVAVVAPTLMEAVGLATAVFVLGPEEGLKLIEDQPGIEAIFVNDQKQVTITPGLNGKLKITDSDFSLNPEEK